MTANAYSFLPWLRQGIATLVGTAPAGPAPTARAQVPVALRLTGEAVSGDTPVTLDVQQTVQIYGPGDVIGVDPRAIVRTEPRDWITNFEPNFLPFIEFYDEDFPWRYSPAAPETGAGRLRPWLALVVLAAPAEDAEFVERSVPGRPLPLIEVPDLGVLPPAGQLGAWAHVHVNGGLTAAETETVSNDMAQVLPRLRDVLRANPDLACSRLICPRRLAPSTPYHAFLVPAFESGRLAGLGLDPAAVANPLVGAWDAYQGRPEPTWLPYYHRWYFHTGTAGDFEHLVRLLKPRELDARIGNRDVDVHASPGAGLPGITTPADLGGVLRLGGALKVPDQNLTEAERLIAQRYEEWDLPYPHPFQQALAALINLADDYTGQEPATANQRLAAAAGTPAAMAEADPDPLITPPLYGRWHALTARLLTDRDGDPLDPDLDPAQPAPDWVHELNLDPRFRIAAGLGTKVVRERQEEFIAAAWAQVGQVLEANRRIRAAQLAQEVGTMLHDRHLLPLHQVAVGKAMTVTAPAHARLTVGLVSGGASAADRAAAAATGTTDGEPVRRVAVGFRVAGSRVAASPFSPAMRRMTRPGSRLMRKLFPPESIEPTLAAARPGRSAGQRALVARQAVQQAWLERMDDDQDPVTAAPPKRMPEALVSVGSLQARLHPVVKVAGGADRARGAPMTAISAEPEPPDPVGNLPLSNDFRLTFPGDTFLPARRPPDSAEAVRVKDGLREIAWGLSEAARLSGTTQRHKLGVPQFGGAALQSLHPRRTVGRRLRRAMTLPPRFATHVERLVEAMAYPVFDLPMYQPLLDMSAELFLPNLDLIPQDSVTLLETNQRFIESYLVGLNHELARELLWREFPTDQRGTPFRQFWDVRTARAVPGETAAQRRERLYDIPPIHQWPPGSALGSHDHREAGGAPEDELILVIRGELLKKYPTAVVYAHKAAWPLGPDGQPDQSKERILDPAGVANPTPATVQLPLYEARAQPDIFLFGFDLTEEEALGGTGNAGWFFVIKERPGEPRFGLDIEAAGPLEVWNDLAWPQVAPGGEAYIPVGPGAPTLTLPRTEPSEPEKRPQWLEDSRLTWSASASAADIAYLTFQAPVLVAIHAAEMLGGT